MNWLLKESYWDICLVKNPKSIFHCCPLTSLFWRLTLMARYSTPTPAFSETHPQNPTHIQTHTQVHSASRTSWLFLVAVALNHAFLLLYNWINIHLFINDWKTPNTWEHAILTLPHPPPSLNPSRSDYLWVRQVTFNKSLNGSCVSIKNTLVSFPNWPLDREVDGASTELDDQYAEAAARRESVERDDGSDRG